MNQGITIRFTEEEMLIIARQAKQTELGGLSTIRLAEDRLTRLAEDQYVGAMGEAALSKYLTGSLELYEKTRLTKNLKPWDGDGGCDLLGYKIDIKTSLMRSRLGHDYHLWVRSKEYHPEGCYILGLAQMAIMSDIYLAGWVGGWELEYRENRWEKRQTRLHPLPRLDIEIAQFKMEWISI